MRRLFMLGMALFVIACEEVIPEGAPSMKFTSPAVSGLSLLTALGMNKF